MRNKRTNPKRKKNSAQQKDCEEKYKIVADGTYDWEFWLNPEGQFLYISPSCARISGYDPEDFISDSELRIRLIHPEDIERFRLHVEEVEQKQSRGEVEFRIICKDGTIRWIGHVCQPVFDNQGRYLGVRGSKRDITDRKEGEVALRKSKEQFELLSEMSGQLLSTQNPQQIVNDFCLKVMRFLNCEVFFHFMVDEKENSLLLKARAGIPDETARDIDRLDAGRAICGASPCKGTCVVTGDFPDTRATGMNIITSLGIVAYACQPLFSEGCVIGRLFFGSRSRNGFTREEIQLLKTVADQVAIAIERKKREISAQEEKRRLLYALQATAEGVWDWNIKTGEVYFSPNWIQSLGYSLQEVPPRLSFWEEIVHPDDIHRVQKARHDHIVGKTPVYKVENRLRKKNGEYRWNLDRGKVVEWDSEGNPLRMIGTDTDITDRKLAEEDKQRLRDELAYVTRIATVSELAASLAHELNQPLTAILSNAQAAQRFLQRGSLDIKEIYEALQDIVDDDQRAGDVIRSLRSLLDKSNRKRIPVNINKVIEETIPLLHGELIQKGISVSLNLDNNLPLMMGDLIQLQQVVMNLVINAFEAMIENKPGTKRIRIETLFDKKGKIKVSIIDSGTGIPPEYEDFIFKPFFTTKLNGMGMGLSINRSIIQAHGGFLIGTNNPDQGATFSFILPVSLEDGR